MYEREMVHIHSKQKAPEPNQVAASQYIVETLLRFSWCGLQSFIADFQHIFASRNRSGNFLGRVADRSAHLLGELSCQFILTLAYYLESFLYDLLPVC